MSNVSSPKGFQPKSHLKGGTLGRLNEYTIAGGYAADLHFGQAVQSSGTGRDIIASGVGGVVRGVFQGAEYQATDGEIRYVKNWVSGTAVKTGTTVKAFIIDDPDTAFQIQVDSPGMTAAKVGLFANILIGSGNDTTGQSTAQVDESTLGTGDQVKVLGLAGDNTYALNSDVIVMFVNHELSGAIAGVEVQEQIVMSMNRATFRKQLQEGLNTVYGLEYKRYVDEWKHIFSIEHSTKAFEEDVLLAGLGPAFVKPEGGSVTYDQGGEAYTSRYQHETISLAFSITEEAEEDNLYGSIGAKYSRALARSMKHTKEVKGAAILNNGFDSNFAGGDGVPLYSTAHPLWSGGTQANTFATQADLAEASLEEALIVVSKFVDERGIPSTTIVQKMIAPPELVFTSNRILKTVNRVGTADNDINAIHNMGMVAGGCFENHRLTDPDAWFLITDCADGLKHIIRKNISRGLEGDFETGNLRYKARERYSFGHSDYRGSFGSSGN